MNETTRKALEAAAGLALARTHYEIDIEHVLSRLLDRPDSDFAAILRQFELDPAGIQRGLDRSLDGFKTGNGRAPGFSPRLSALLREAWLTGSLQFSARMIRSGHLVLALVSETTIGRTVNDVLPLLNAIRAERLAAEFPAIVAETAERELTPQTGPASSAGPAMLTATPHLDAYTIDLTAEARAGRIDPVIGRDAEVRQIVDILSRRRQNNPILLGEAGVGKTAIVESFALRIATGKVPPALQAVAVRTLDLGLMQAGAGVKGEFERRLKAVIQEVKSSAQPVVLFIDEAHQLIGAGGQAGQGDAANLLKPDLARGELRVIAATTWGEYKKYVERDAALTRRFQVVRVEEPSEAMAIDIMRGLADTFAGHHKVRILDEAVRDAVRLSKRYIPARQLPDKSVSLLDTAASMVAMSRTVQPAALEDVEREQELAGRERATLEREAAAGVDHHEALQGLNERLAALDARHDALSAQWNEERQLLERLAELHAGRSADEAPDIAHIEQIKATEAKLRQVQGDAPLLHDAVDGQAVAKIVAGWTGIPVGRMVTSDIEAALDLDRRLAERIVGQDHAIRTIADAIRTAKAKLLDPRKPPAVFLLVGTSGVGKTETALALADILYGGEQSLTVINMSEFKEEHKVSMLVGSPPGYVGYGEGGVLTEAVRRRPYGVLLLDEMEKAHPGVQDVFYQVFDKGTLRDGEGRDIDFRNTTILMASNAGTELLAQLAADPEAMPDGAALTPLIRPELLKHFKPAFLGRVSVVPYLPLPPSVLRRIVELQIDKIRARVAETYRATLKVESAVLDQIVARCSETDTGARAIEHILTGSLMPALSRQFLTALADRQQIERVTVGLGADGAFHVLADTVRAANIPANWRDPAHAPQMAHGAAHGAV
ncbi:ClpV1 family T6SS ATPase [Aliidongia dinghuensis]|uniref:ClpV1 family T6SS ATPase n=1 Tax=Aliidongia dinghuensis TaxID=1867774 RepID=A0A8J2YUJ2_9PROT|nr:ClpV1 family T6SS ATPase [Aliidongia dinghuensis]